MISTYPHIAFFLALFCGAAVGLIVAGIVRIAKDADDDQMSDYDSNN